MWDPGIDCSGLYLGIFRYFINIKYLDTTLCFQRETQKNHFDFKFISNFGLI